MDEKIKAFAELVEREQRERYLRQYPQSPADLTDMACRVTVKPGKKYIKVDVGTSGKYMVDQAGAIWGIKAYGVIHHGHQYGTLDTIGAWNWGGYAPEAIAEHSDGSEIRHPLEYTEEEARIAQEQ